MVLESQKLSTHNQMIGRFLQKSNPTNADSDMFSESRPAKRIKLDAADDKPKIESSHVENAAVIPKSLLPNSKLEIPDSDAEDGSEEIERDVPDHSSSQPTDLEQALPPIKTDREAIEEYEAFQAAKASISSDIHNQLENRKSIKGRSSIYVDAFNLALETVLDEESHLFDAVEMQVFESWKRLGYEAQYLYVRLFLRKTAAWHRIARLGYYSDIADMESAIDELFEPRKLPEISQTVQANPGEFKPPVGSTLAESFTFADNSDDHINTLEEASSLLLLDELKVLAKEAKVQGKNKTELLRALRRASGQQAPLPFPSLTRSDTEDSYQSAVSDDRDDSPANNRDAHFLKKIMSETGRCIRLSPAPLKLFERVHLVFYRSTEWTEKSLTIIILARIARRNFPDYIVSRSASIFDNRRHLLEFEAALRTQQRIDDILEFHGTPTRESLLYILEIFQDVYPRWKALLAEEQAKEDSIYLSGEGAYLRRLSPAWVYTRIVHKASYITSLGKVRDHAKEYKLLCELLEQRLFHPARRGVWYQRKALLEEHYMYNLTPDDGRTPEQQKKHWKQIALCTCEEGLQDNLTHVVYHYDLQKRIRKLEKALKIPKRLQHEFAHTSLAKPTERTFEAIRIEREALPKPKATTTTAAAAAAASTPTIQRKPSNDKTTQSKSSQRGAKTIWLDPYPAEDAPPNSEVSVEAMCLSHYRALGWKGYHTEGGVLRTLFALLFYDVLFTYIPNVFQTPYQTCPLDLHTDTFYPSRISEINARLAEIANGHAESLLTTVWLREQEKKTCVVGLDWSFDLADLQSIARAFDGHKLALVCNVLAQEYAERGGGMPDLFLWMDPCDECPSGDVMFAEVKSENDRLSDTQRLWIHVLAGAGVRIELCHAVASEVRVV